MSGRPESVDPRLVRGFEVRCVAEVVDTDGTAAALQIAFADGSSLVCSAWTDWTLVVERRPDTVLPDHFWLAGSFATRPFPTAVGAKVVLASVVRDEVAQVMGVHFVIGEQQISVRAYGGGIAISA